MKTRTLLLYSFLVCLFSTESFTQNITLGFSPGIQIATFDIDDEDDPLFSEGTDYRTGPNFKAFINFEISPNFLIQTEGGFNQKGMILSFATTDINGVSIDFEEIEMVFNYVEVPVLAVYRLNRKNVNFYAFGGPSFGYLTSAFTKFMNVKEQFEFEEDDGINRYEVSLIGGLKIGIPFGNGELFFDGRYQRGISNLDEDSDNSKIFNSGFGLGIGYSFKITKE